MGAFDDAVREEVERMMCRCIPAGRVTITTHCLIHDPFARMARGEDVEFIGFARMLELLEIDLLGDEPA